MSRPRLAPALSGGAALATAAVMCAAPGAADPQPSPSATSLLPSTATFQVLPCAADGAHQAYVTVTNGSTASQTFGFTTSGGKTANPPGTNVPPGGKVNVRVSAPASAKALFVSAGGTAVGSTSFSSCTSGSASTSHSSQSGAAGPSATSGAASQAPQASEAAASPAASRVATSADSSTSSTNPLLVAGGIALGVLGLAIAAFVIRREFS